MNCEVKWRHSCKSNVITLYQRNEELMGAFLKNIYKIKMQNLDASKKKNPWDGIEKSVPHDHRLSSLCKPVFGTHFSSPSSHS